MKDSNESFATLKRSDNVIPDYDYLFKEDFDKRGKKRNRFLYKLLKMNIWSIILNCLVYLLQSSPVYIVPILTADIINVVTDAITLGVGVTTDVVVRMTVDSVVIFVFIVQNVPSTVLRNTITSRTLRRTSAGIKSTVVRKLQSLSVTYHKDMQTGTVQSKFLKDTDSIDSLFSCIMQSFIPSLLSAIVSAFIAFYKNKLVALFFVCIVPFNVVLTLAFRKKIRRTYRDYRIKTETMSNKLTNMLLMTPVTKSHGLEEIEIESVENSIRQLQRSGKKVDYTTAFFGSWSWVVNNFLNAACLVFCACLALKGIIKIGDIVLYQSMFASLSGNITSLVGMMPQLASGAEALGSVSEIMNVSDVEYNVGKKVVGDLRGDVEFVDVSYHYPNNEQLVVRDFSLSVKSGECVAVVGPSGSGKSTIMNLVIGFLKPTSGKVLIDGKSIEEVDLSEYRHHISVVPQNSILFAGTIRENITYGMAKYTEEQLQKVVEEANITEFLAELPDGLDTYIGENGGKLSGGQKQRITIARALIRDPRILILDEATSALDNISEFHVQKAICSCVKGRTTFIVAHRLSTIRDADRIVVMENGVCVESGTYEQLVVQKGKFFQLKSLNDIVASDGDNA